MILIRKCLVTLACIATLTGGVAAQQTVPESRVIRLTSLEWPPYTGPALRRQGATTAVVRAAFAAMGYGIEVEFYPWSRAVASIRQDSEFVGYFPEYMSPEIARGFLMSDPIGSGPLGFAELADKPVHWENLDDLARYRIGVVQDYVNTEEFDKRVREGKLTTDSTLDDAHNLLKLAAGRVTLAVVDKRVFEYLLRNDARLKRVASRLHFNSHLLEDKQLYICFRRSPEGERARNILNAGLRKIDIPAVMATTLK
jgi:polar amino acid transport system substrate-binding protein